MGELERQKLDFKPCGAPSGALQRTALCFCVYEALTLKFDLSERCPNPVCAKLLPDDSRAGSP